MVLYQKYQAMSIGLPQCSWDTSSFCVLIHLLPQLYNYDEDTDHLHLAMMPDHSRPKRAIPILIPFLVSSGIGGSAALGTSALIL